MQRFTRWGSKNEKVKQPFLLHARAKQASPTLASVESLDVMLAQASPSVPFLEFRHFNSVLSVKRGAGGSRLISALAIPYDVQTEDLGGRSEIYRPGSFRKTINSEDDDQRALINGNIDKVLGRKSAGTLALTEKPDGVHVEISAPETSYADDLLVSIRRGDIDQMTAGFWIQEHRVDYSDRDNPVCVVTRAKLLVVSCSTFSALVGAGCAVEQALAAAQASLADAHAAGFREGQAARRAQASALRARAVAVPEGFSPEERAQFRARMQDGSYRLRGGIR
jgi:uncharacterized protein